MTTMTKDKPMTDTIAQDSSDEVTSSSTSARAGQASEAVETKSQTKTTPSVGTRTNKARALMGRLKPSDGAHFVPTLVWAVLTRAVTLFGCYLVLVVTVFGLIPFIGAWIHQQGAGRSSNLSMDGVIAAWVVPFAFTTLLLAVAEMALMREMWRAGTRLIARIKSGRAEATEDIQTEPHESASTTPRAVAQARPKTPVTSKPRQRAGSNRNKKKR